MKIARRNLTEREELDGRLEWFLDLRESVLNNEKEIALASIDSAIKMLTSTVGGDDRT